MPSPLRLLACCLPLLLAAHGPAHAALESHTLDFESSWADLAPNTFVQISTLQPAPGGLHWGEGWYGQTTVPVLGSNNELRLGAGSFQVDAGGQAFYLDSVDFRSMENGGSISFDFLVRTDSQTHVYALKIDGAPTEPGVPVTTLHFTTFTDMAALGPVRSFGFGNFKAKGETTDRNLFVMDNLHYRLEATPAVPEPASAALLGLGMAAMALRRRRCRV